MMSSSFYQGAIEGFKSDIERVTKSGVTINFAEARLKQLELMLNDFRDLEQQVKGYYEMLSRMSL